MSGEITTPILPQPGDDLNLWAQDLVAVLGGIFDVPETLPGSGVALPILDTGGRPVVTDQGIFAYSSLGIAVVAPNLVQIDTTELANNAVTTAKVAAAAITTAKLVNAAVDNSKLAINSVGAANILNDAVTTQKILDAAIVGAKIASGEIASTHIQNLAVTNAHIAAVSIDATQIQNAAINTAHIQTAAITNTLIASAAIATANIQNAAITTALIGNLAVVDAKIANLAVNKLTSGIINAAILTLSTLNGVFHSGQTAFDTGVGFWLDGLGRFSLGNSGGNKLAWDGAALSVQGNVTIQGGSGIANLVDAGAFATASQITSGNISTFIDVAAIGKAYIASLDAGVIDSGVLKGRDIQTTGTHLTVATVNGVNLTLTVADTTDFAPTGTGVYVHPTGPSQSFTWNGKTATTLLNSSILVALPVETMLLSQSGFILGTTAGELRYFSDLTGILTEAVKIGYTNALDSQLVTLAGELGKTTLRVAGVDLGIWCSTQDGVSGTAVQGRGNIGLYGALNGPTIITNTAQLNLAAASTLGRPTHVATAGSMFVESSGRLFYNTYSGAEWGQMGPAAYVKFTGLTANGACVIGKSFNVSNVDRVGVAAYRITFTNALTDTDFVVGVTGSRIAGNTFAGEHSGGGYGGRTTTQVVIHFAADGAAGGIDPDFASILIWGS